MKDDFYKYHGTGNDFIILDQLETIAFEPSDEVIRQWCNRRTGIGADGLIILKPSKQYSFYMDYFNSDGNRSTLCGNGSRCAVAYFYSRNKVSEIIFEAIDGPHDAIAEEIKGGETMVSVKMNDIDEVNNFNEGIVLDTGSPHYVLFPEKDLDEINIDSEGRKIRYNENFAEQGINVNFVKVGAAGPTGKPSIKTHR